MANGVSKRKLRRAIKRSEVRISRDQLVAAWKRSDGARLRIHAYREHYWAQVPEVWNDILLYSDVDEQRYDPDRFTCLDFATALKGEVAKKLRVNSVGIVLGYTMGHAIIALPEIQPNDAIRIRLVESQTDGTVRKGQPIPGTRLTYALARGWAMF